MGRYDTARKIEKMDPDANKKEKKLWKLNDLEQSSLQNPEN